MFSLSPPFPPPPKYLLFSHAAEALPFGKVLDQVKMRGFAFPDQAVRTLDVPQDAQTDQQPVQTL